MAMGFTKLTSAPTGFEYYRVCDRDGVCRVVRGSRDAQHLVDIATDATSIPTKLSPTHGWDGQLS